MMQKVSSNDKISFLFSKTNAIDIEALNIVAGKTELILCNCVYSEQNGKHKLDYEASLANNLFLKKDSFRLEEFVQECLRLFEVIKKYNLNLINVQENVQHIYKCEVGYRFIYIPIIRKKSTNYKKFIIKLLGQLKSKDSRIAGVVKEIKRYKTDDEVLTYLIGFVSVPNTERASLIISNMETEGETTILSQGEPEGETTFLEQHTTAFLPSDSAECETTFLADDAVFRQEREIVVDERYDLYLLRVGTGEQIHINKTGYSIGKDIHNMDYVLGNASVSRNHATLYIEEGKFYLTDNGSTNGTTIEGIRVQMGERAELSDGDIISLGNEIFQVLLERKVL